MFCRKRICYEQKNIFHVEIKIYIEMVRVETFESVTSAQKKLLERLPLNILRFA